MTLEMGLIAASTASALVYGAFLAVRAPWAAKTSARLLARVGLVAVMLVDAGPAALIGGAAFAWFGEIALASRSRWRPDMVITALTISNLAYAGLFRIAGGGLAALAAEPWRAVGVFGAPALAAMQLTRVWPRVIRWRAIVAINATASAGMGALAFTLPHAFWTAMPGAILTLAASTPTARLAVDERRREIMSASTWVIGMIGQALIAYAFLF